MKKGLQQVGMIKPSFDLCLIYRKIRILIYYINEVGLSAPTKTSIVMFVQKLRSGI